MKIKEIILLFLLSMTFQECYAEINRDELKEAVKGISIYSGIDILIFHNNKYIVSVADSEINGNTPSDKLNAMKVAKQVSESELSKFVNGEDIHIKERLSSIRVTKSSNDTNKIVSDNEVYEEFIRNRSSGAIKGMRSFRWRSGNLYYVATLLKFTENKNDRTLK